MIERIPFFCLFLLILGTPLESLEAKQGLLDLSEIDLNQTGLIALSGEWEFYWERFIFPGDSFVQPKYITVPGTWNDFKKNNEPLGKAGYATYRLRVWLDKSYGTLGIRFYQIQSSCELWIDGELIIKRGKIGTRFEDTVYFTKLGYFYFPAQRKEIEICFLISNYANPSGGITDSVYLGTAEALTKDNNLFYFFNTLFSGIMGGLTMLSLATYLFMRKERRYLYFLLFTLSLLLRHMFSGVHIILDLLPLSANIYLRLEYAPLVLAPICFLLLLKNIFESPWKKKEYFFFLFPGLIFSGFIFFVPFKNLPDLLVPLQLFLVFCLICIIHLAFLNFFRGEPDSMVLAVGVFFICFGVILDLLNFYLLFLKDGSLNFTASFFTLFIFFLALRFSRDHAQAMTIQQNLLGEREKKADDLAREVEEKTRKVIQASRQQTEFFMNIAHEIKTPLTVVLNYFSSIKEKLRFSDTDFEKSLNQLKDKILLVMDEKKDDPGEGIAIPETDQRKNILIVEDNMELLELLTERLRPYFEVFSCRNALEAIELLNFIRPPDLIVSDIMMDEMDGYEFLKTFRAKKSLALIPFIFITAKTGQEERIKALTLGCLDFIEKPFHVSDLILKIRAVLSSNEKSRNKSRSKLIRELRKVLRQRKTGLMNLFPKGLSLLEKKAAGLILKRKTNQEISRLLDLSPGQTAQLVRKIFEKCSVKDRKELWNKYEK